ncbi:MAG TPA: SdpI family protein [Usitatibacter sp.]
MAMWNWYPAEMDWALVACILTAATSVPLALRLIPPNSVYGFRTRFTRSDPRVWYDANAFVGRLMVVASIASAAILLWSPLPAEGWVPAAVVLAPVALVTLAGFVYLRHLRETVERR